tara:strand:- start:17130 stop:17372 length:243 start_codon:yes stop_codon:yes gene_type:complete
MFKKSKILHTYIGYVFTGSFVGLDREAVLLFTLKSNNGEKARSILKEMYGDEVSLIRSSKNDFDYRAGIACIPAKDLGVL